MALSSQQHVLIIGNGIAGVTAARHIRKNSDAKITIISEEHEYHFSRTALMYIYMGHMKVQHTQPYEKRFWKKNKIELLKAKVVEVQTEPQQLLFANGEALKYDELILATGSTPRSLGCPGEDLKGVQGLFHLWDLERMEEATQGIQQAVVVGGGLIGIEMAEMLLSRGVEVHFLIRENTFWGSVLPPQEASFISDYLSEIHGLHLHFETEVAEIIGDSSGKVKGLITNNGVTVDCQFVGVSIGVVPNVDFVKDTAIELGRGVLVDDYLQSSVPNIYAIGDCAQLRKPLHNRRPIEAVWYTGRAMGKALGQHLSLKPTQYQQSFWFNSAKFFEIEYQTYGTMPARISDEEEELYWQSDAKHHAVHIRWDKASKAVLGINTFGIRMRQEVWQEWIEMSATIDAVIENLAQANFDPEFYKDHTAAIQASFKARRMQEVGR